MDPSFRQRIQDRLNEHLDAELVEQAAVTMARTMPGLEALGAVTGGTDFGRDATTSDRPEGTILTVTTGKDVKRNLRESLERYVASGYKARQVVVATTQPDWSRGTQRKALEGQAQTKGFTVVNVYDCANRIGDDGLTCRNGALRRTRNQSPRAFRLRWPRLAPFVVTPSRRSKTTEPRTRVGGASLVLARGPARRFMFRRTSSLKSGTPSGTG